MILKCHMLKKIRYLKNTQQEKILKADQMDSAIACMGLPSEIY